MKHTAFYIVILLVMALAIVTICAAVATAGTVHVQPIYDQIVNPFLDELFKGLEAAAVAFCLFLLHLVIKAVRIIPDAYAVYLEANARNALNTALQNGVAAGMHKVENIERLHSDIEVKGELKTFAMNYAIKHASDAILHFGIRPEDLAVKALAYIPTAPTVTDTTGATAKLAPVVSEPLHG